MKPFLLIQLRAPKDVREDEYQKTCLYGGLKPEQVHRLNPLETPEFSVDLSQYSGIIVGGSEFNALDDESKKSPKQLQIEHCLRTLLRDIIANDFPYIGLCYGMTMLTLVLGGKASTKFGEQLGGPAIEITSEGLKDPAFAGLTSPFYSLASHNEATDETPPNCALLATTKDCPVYMYRHGNNVYGIQFHPEVDDEAIDIRIRAYVGHGHFDESQLENVIKEAQQIDINENHKVLKNWVDSHC